MFNFHYYAASDRSLTSLLPAQLYCGEPAELLIVNSVSMHQYIAALRVGINMALSKLITWVVSCHGKGSWRRVLCRWLKCFSWNAVCRYVSQTHFYEGHYFGLIYLSTTRNGNLFLEMILPHVFMTLMKSDKILSVSTRMIMCRPVFPR